VATVEAVEAGVEVAEGGERVICTGWSELKCHAEVADWKRVKPFSGLTSVFWAENGALLEKYFFSNQSAIDTVHCK
jgi:hypothetical protein